MEGLVCEDEEGEGSAMVDDGTEGSSVFEVEGAVGDDDEDGNLNGRVI